MRVCGIPELVQADGSNWIDDNSSLLHLGSGVSTIDGKHKIQVCLETYIAGQLGLGYKLLASMFPAKVAAFISRACIPGCICVAPNL